MALEDNNKALLLEQYKDLLKDELTIKNKNIEENINYLEQYEDAKYKIKRNPNLRTLFALKGYENK